MGLDLSKLENVKYCGNYIIARCPACSEEGRDKSGNHLSIDPRGKYTCVTNSGITGYKHRKRIYQLVGISDNYLDMDNSNAFHDKKEFFMDKIKVILPDVLGRLGRLNLSYANIEDNSFQNKSHINIEESVPSVPFSEESQYISLE